VALPHATTRDPSHPAHPIRPLRTALLLAGAYLVLCSVYIVLSSAWAAHAAGSIVELKNFEQWKGLGFVAVTGALFFAVAWWLLDRIAGQSAALERQRALLEAAEGPALAGAFSAAIAHDINNVLAVARAGLDGLTWGEDEDRRERASMLARRALEDLAKIAKRMSRLGAEPRGPRRRLEDLSEIVQDTVAFGRRHPKILGSRIEVEAPPSMAAEVDRTLIQRALLNLLLNAAEATGGAGRIRVELRRDVADSRQVVIDVHDDGPGVPEERREEIFTVFHSTKPDGTGLGLFSVRGAAEAHEGEARVTDSDLGGACFRLRFRVSSKRS
jgi:signal transduction histidine kinase